MARNYDWVGLSAILAGIALIGALGVQPSPPPEPDNGCCFQVRHNSPQEEILAEVDGRGPTPLLTAELWSGRLHARLTRGLSQAEYQTLLQQVGEDGLWQTPTEVPYGGPLGWPLTGRPSPPSHSTQRDDRRLSERFFRYPAVVGLTRQLRQHALLAEERQPGQSLCQPPTQDIAPHW